MASHLRMLSRETTDDLGKVQGAPVGVLSNLFATAETVCDNQSIRGCISHSRKQHALAECLRYLVLFLLKTERPSHATAASVKHFNLRAGRREYGKFIVHLHQRLVMAMTMQHNTLTLKRRRLVSDCSLSEELAEQQRLVA